MDDSEKPPPPLSTPSTPAPLSRRPMAREPTPFRPLRFLVLLLLLLPHPSCSGTSGPDTPGAPAELRALEGQGAQGPAGTVLPEGPTVEVRDRDGHAVPGATVSFQVMEGGGSTPLSTAEADGQGRARGIWILGLDAGAIQRLRATAGDASVEFQAVAIEPTPGESYYGRNQYVEYFPGNLPLILSAPHGGDLEPGEIPDRTSGTTVTDRNTRELALAVRAAIRDRTGAYPHLVISHLDRVKLDPNREIVEAAQGDAEAERAWWEYHTFLDRAGEIVEASHGEGLYIDLHGHGHELQRLELGYLVGSSTLAGSDAALNGVARQSSFRALAERPGEELATLIRGPQSLGTLMEGEGFPAVPSTGQPDPGGNPYFTGGYSTVRHGSRDGGSVSGVQIECNYTGVRDLATSRQRFAEALVQALTAFFPAHFGFPLASSGAEAPLPSTVSAFSPAPTPSG